MLSPATRLVRKLPSACRFLSGGSGGGGGGGGGGASFALTAEQQHSMDQAVPLIKEAARQEHVLAQKICGELYSYGHGLVEDERLAFAYTEKAALQGLAESQYVCAVRRCTGIGCAEDFDEARRFFKMAADQGDEDAINALRELDAKTGRTAPKKKEKKPKPNAPCSCGSGKKYKKCCGSNK